MKFQDLTSQRFNRWLVIKKSKNRGIRTTWECICDCGTKRNVLSCHLKSGRSKSCGCLHREITSNRYTGRLIGRRFSKLLVIDQANERSNDQKILWICKCDCGNIIKIRSNDLVLGKQKSCGCWKSAQSSKRCKKRNKNYIQENHPNWKGGYSPRDYYPGFTEKLKNKIKQRDRFMCQDCGSFSQLVIHHIDYDKRNNDPDNLITLCRSCHCKSNFNRDDWQVYLHSKVVNGYNLKTNLRPIILIDCDGTIFEEFFPQGIDGNQLTIKKGFKRFSDWAIRYFDIHVYSSRFNTWIHGLSESLKQLELVRKILMGANIKFSAITPFKSPAVVIIDDRNFGFDIKKLPRKIEWDKIKNCIEESFSDYIKEVENV